MMKKLLMWSALLMTGFAFYSCDDVVDNPVQNDSAVWNYSVTVKFADFDFKGLVDPVSSEKYAYEAPKTLYVFNEELEPLGTIATNTPPSAGGSAKYEGTLRGAIGNNLIITTKTGVDYAKQDGTIESIIENAIVQSAKVAVRLYSNYNYNLATYDAEMENNVAIAHFSTGAIEPGDPISFTSDKIELEGQTLSMTLSEDLTGPVDFYVAIPTVSDEEIDYTLTSKLENGKVFGTTLEKFKLKVGEVNNADDTGAPFIFGYEAKSIDLTVYDAWWRAQDGNSGWNYIGQWLNDGNTYIITQSGEAALDSITLEFYGSVDSDISITLDNIKLGKSSFVNAINANTEFNLIGANEFNSIFVGAPVTTKGTGSWAFNRLEMRSNPWGWSEDTKASYTIDKDMTLSEIEIAGKNAVLTVKDGIKLTAINNDKDKEEDVINISEQGTLKIGKGATLEAENKANERSVIVINEGGNLEIADNGIVTIQSAIEAPAISITEASNIKLGKLANMTVTGGTLSAAIQFNCWRSVDNVYTFTLDEGATLTAKGNDRPGILFTNNPWQGDNVKFNATFAIAKDAKVISEAIGKQAGFVVDCYGNTPMNLEISGKGTFEAKSAKGQGMIIEASYYPTLFTLKDGITLLATGGKENPAIVFGSSINTTIDKTITKIIATSGEKTNPRCIVIDDNEANLGLAAADFNDDMGLDKNNEPTGVRTITPKAE